MLQQVVEPLELKLVWGEHLFWETGAQAESLGLVCWETHDWGGFRFDNGLNLKGLMLPCIQER